MPLRPVLRLLLAGLLAGFALLASFAAAGPHTPPLRVGYQVAHADGPGDWPMFRHDLGSLGGDGFHLTRLSLGASMQHGSIGG